MKQIHRRRHLAAERHGHGIGESRDGVDLGDRVADLAAVALGETAGDDETGAVLAAVGQRQDRVDRLLARRLDEGARVDDDDVGIGRRGHEPIGQERAGELVGIDLVLRAAQCLHPEAPCHPDRVLVLYLRIRRCPTGTPATSAVAAAIIKPRTACGSAQ